MLCYIDPGQHEDLRFVVVVVVVRGGGGGVFLCVLLLLLLLFLFCFEGGYRALSLEERGVERGSARRSSLRGRERAIVSQTNTGTV